MTECEIAELFIRAAEVERKLPNTARPAHLKAMNMGYVHSFADMNGWDQDEKHAANWAWLDPKKLRATTGDVGIWEAAMEVMKLVPDPKKRRALWAWAKAEAGGQAFAKWCKNAEGISRQLGDWRRKAAIECISLTFARKPLQHNENSDEPDFTNRPEISDKSTTMRVWRPDDSKPVCDFDADLRDFSWAEAQNERRRQRENRAA
ncbi:hypothetical protein [Sinorhizobium medicae]